MTSLFFSINFSLFFYTQSEIVLLKFSQSKVIAEVPRARVLEPDPVAIYRYKKKLKYLICIGLKLYSVTRELS